MLRRRKIIILLVVLAVLLANGVLLVGSYLTSDRIRVKVEDAARKLLGTDVSIGRIKVNLTGLLELDSVRLFLPKRQGSEPAATFDRITVDCTLTRLLLGEGGFDELEIIGPRVRFDRELREFIGGLHVAPSAGSADYTRMPKKISVRSAAITIDADTLYAGSPRIELTDLDLKAQADSFSASQFTLRGSMRQSVVGTINVSGQVDLLAKSLSLTAEIPSIGITRELRDMLPREAGKVIDDIGLAGNAGVALKLDAGWGAQKLLRQSIVATAQNCSVRVKDLPLPLTQLDGVIESDGKTVKIRRAIGRYKEGTIEVTHGYVDDKISEFELLGRNIPLDEDVKASLPPDASGILTDFNIAGGHIDFTHRFIIYKHKGRIFPEHSLDLVIRNVNAMAKDFPYPATDVQGRIHWESCKHGQQHGSVDVGVAGMAGEGTFTVSGRVPTPKPGFDLSDEMLAQMPPPDYANETFDRGNLMIAVQRLEIDDAARAAAPPEVVEILDEVAPQGNVDIAVLLGMEVRGKQVAASSAKVSVNLNSITAAPRGFPCPIKNLTGRVEWQKDHVKLTALHGICSGADVRITGELAIGERPEDGAGNAVFIRIEGIGITEQIVKALPPDVAGTIESLQPKGNVDVAAAFDIRKGDGGKKVLSPRHVAVTLNSISARVKEFPYPVSRLTGRVEWDGRKVALLGLRGFCGSAGGQAEVKIAGEIDLAQPASADPNGADKPAGGSAAGNVFVTAQGLQLDEQLRASLSDDLKAVWDQFSPSGRVNALCLLNLGPAAAKAAEDGRAADAGRDVVRKVVIDLDRCQATYSAIPFPLDNITGKIVLENGCTSLEKIVGYSGNATVTLCGRLTHGDSAAGPGEESAADPQTCGQLNVQVRNILFNSALRKAVPASWAATWDALRPEGEGNADLVVVFPGDATTRIAKGSFISLRAFHLNGFPFPDTTFPVTADDTFIHTSEFSGNYYGGTIRGSARVGRKDGKFEIALKIYNADLKQFNDDRRLIMEDIRGQATVTVQLSGEGADSSSLAGAAALRVQNGELAKIPAIAALVMRMLNLAPSGHNSITDAEASCTLGEGKVTFDEVVLTGTGVPITGDGSIGLDGAVDMDFYTSSKDKKGLLEQVPIFGIIWKLFDEQVFSHLRDVVVHVKMTGQIRNPDIRPVPFSKIVRPVESLFRLIMGGDDTKSEKSEPSQE